MYCIEHLCSLTCQETKISLLPLLCYPPVMWEHAWHHCLGDLAEGNLQRMA